MNLVLTYLSVVVVRPEVLLDGGVQFVREAVEIGQIEESQELHVVVFLLREVLNFRILMRREEILPLCLGEVAIFWLSFEKSLTG